MSLLSKLTIIIPTYNRQEYVLRNMQYWSNYDVTVHIFDGTSLPIDEHLIMELGCNINYHHMPCCLFDRLGKSIDCVDTEYSMMMSDDEFYIPSALESCIGELECNKDLVSCMGLAVGFSVIRKQVFGAVIYDCLRTANIMQDRPCDRSYYHMNNYCPSTIYSVMRSSVWKKSMKSLSYKNYETYFKSVGELQFEITSAYLGKSKIIKELMWLRSNENIPNSLHTGDASVSIKDNWYKDINSDIRNEIIDSIVRVIEPEDVPMVKICISKSFDGYIEKVVKKIDKKSFRKIALLILPKWAISLIRKILERVSCYLKSRFLTSVVKKNYIDTGVKVDKHQLNKIIDIISKFHFKY